MKKRVLLIDDEEGFTRLLKLNLLKTGRFEVDVENDSTKAFLKARSFNPDVIVLDVVMPNLDGGDVQAQLQTDPELSSVPVIMLTALVDSNELSQGAVAQAGATTVLPKPVDLDLLLQLFDEIFEGTEGAPA